MRKCFVALVIVAELLGSVHQSKAAVGPPPVPAVVGTSIGAGAWVAGGIIGVAAALCLYDIWLKASGFKNWDGSPVGASNSFRPGRQKPGKIKIIVR